MQSAQNRNTSPSLTSSGPSISPQAREKPAYHPSSSSFRAAAALASASSASSHSNRSSNGSNRSSNGSISNHKKKRGEEAAAAAAASVVSKPTPETNKSEADMDELDLLICHEEFESLVALVEKVKHIQQRLLHHDNVASQQHYQRNRPAVPKSCLAPEEVLCVVERLREQLSFGGSTNKNSITIRRGKYPVTDATMDDNFSILQKEFEFCESCFRQQQQQQQQQAGGAGASNQHGYSASSSPYEYSYPSAAGASSSNHPAPPAPSTNTSTTTTNSTKYSKWQSDILLQWLVEHHKDPTLTKPQAKLLAHRTGLTTTQVSTWLQNMRRRRKKNTIQGTKKATHFLDFLFLANERDRKGGILPSHIEIEGLCSASNASAVVGSSTPPVAPRKRKSSSPTVEYPARDYIPYTPPTSSTTTTLIHSRRQEDIVVSDGTATATDTAPSKIVSSVPMDRSTTTGTTNTSHIQTTEDFDSWDGQDLSFAQRDELVGENDEHDSLFDGLQTVTESFDNNEEHHHQQQGHNYDDYQDGLSVLSLEPVTLDFEFDQDLLSVFASNWQHDHMDITATSTHTCTPVRISTSAAQDEEPIDRAGHQGHTHAAPPVAPLSPPQTRSAVAHNKRKNDKGQESRDDHDDLEWMDWDEEGDQYNPLDASSSSPASVFRKNIAAAMVEGDHHDNDDNDDNDDDSHLMAAAENVLDQYHQHHHQHQHHHREQAPPTTTHE